MATATVLVISGLFAALTGLQAYFFQPLHSEVKANQAFLPVTFYISWVCAVLGMVGSVMVLFVQGYRPRWFWWFLCGAVVLWMALVPLGTVIGLVCLVVLMASRRHFSAGGVATPPP